MIKQSVTRPGAFIVAYSKRHPLTGVPITLRRKNIESLKEAKRVEAELILAIEGKIRARIIPTWAALVENFLIEQRSRGFLLRTIENCGLCLKAHTFEAWSSTLIDEIQPQDIRQLVQRRVGEKSIGSQQSLVKFIRGAFRFAVESGYLKASPVPAFRFKISDKVKKVLTEEQAKTLLYKARSEGSEWYYHWALALYTGMRSGELYALTWEKVEFENGRIIVDRAWNSKDGFKSTKSGHDRSIPINDKLGYLLRELKLSGEGGHYVLPRRGKWDKGEQARELQKFLVLIGLPAIRFHDLRATFATVLLSKGVEPVRVMKIGGWRDMKTMMIYLRMAGIDTRNATQCLDLHEPLFAACEVLKMSPRMNIKD